MKKYTLDYFIKKFSEIPRNQWCTGKLANGLGQKCAYGHCGESMKRPTKESRALDALVATSDSSYVGLASVNDGRIGAELKAELGKHPKTRVIRYLKSLKVGKK